MGKGKFITFEGIDGCGKSTQLAITARFLEERGQTPLIIREPGGTSIGEKIRTILFCRVTRPKESSDQLKL